MGIKEDCNELELISVWIPKVGSTSMRQWLERIYSKGEVYNDKTDNPMDPISVVNIDPDGYLESFASGYSFLRNIKAVHEQCWANKYKYIQDVPMVTILRHPVDRILSEYWNFKIFRDKTNSPLIKKFSSVDKYVKNYRLKNRLKRINYIPIKAYFTRRNLSVLEYTRLPMIKNTYTELFFRDVDMGMFDLIGDLASMDKYISNLKAILGKDVDFTLPRVNTTKAKDSGFKEFKQECLDDKVAMAEMNKLLAKEITFYEKYAAK